MKKQILVLLILAVLSLAILGCQTEKAMDKEPVKEAAEEPAKEVVEETTKNEEVMEKATGSSDEVQLLGKEGYSTMELTIKVGDTVSFVNKDPLKKTQIVVFKKGSESFTSNSILSEKEFSHEFVNTGTYEFWSMAHGKKGKIVVE